MAFTTNNMQQAEIINNNTSMGYTTISNVFDYDYMHDVVTYTEQAFQNFFVSNSRKHKLPRKKHLLSLNI